METDKYKIGFIASGKKQIQNALATIQDESVEFRIVRAGLDEAIPIGKNMDEEGFKAILEYKGTAAILRENQTVPVVTIPFTYLDVILSLKEAASLTTWWRSGFWFSIPDRRWFPVSGFCHICQVCQCVRLQINIFNDRGILRDWLRIGEALYVV